jgi:8-oxo-dGTP pyrophosphatase MutT (NUDIX family)
MAAPATSVTLDLLMAACNRPLPGLAAQLRMAPQPRRPGAERILDPGLKCREAAVLLLAYPCPNAQSLCLVLTRRTDTVANHQGQISLPGGSADPGETAEATALRETWEELAVEPAQVRTLARLSRLFVPASNFCIQPVVGYAARRPDFRPQPGEVAEVIEAPFSRLLDPSACVSEVWRLRGEDIRVPFYLVDGHKIWGATAMMLCELLALISSAMPHRGS